MVIYIESVFAFNVLVDYLLLFGAARVAGRTVARRRLLLGAAVGGIYAAVQLFLPKSVVLLLLGLALMGAAAYRGSGRAVKLTLLFFLASCGLAGVVMLLGQSLGSMARLARGVVTADLPWGVFLIAAGTSFLLLSVVFRYGAARTGSETADVVIAYRGKTARVRLLRDTGNTVVVIEHNLDVIKSADWLIDLGPEGGSGGGTLVCAGTPETVAACPQSYTGQYLKKYLK